MRTHSTTDSSSKQGKYHHMTETNGVLDEFDAPDFLALGESGGCHVHALPLAAPERDLTSASVTLVDGMGLTEVGVMGIMNIANDVCYERGQRVPKTN